MLNVISVVVLIFLFHIVMKVCLIVMHMSIKNTYIGYVEDVDIDG